MDSVFRNPITKLKNYFDMSKRKGEKRLQTIRVLAVISVWQVALITANLLFKIVNQRHKNTKGCSRNGTAFCIRRRAPKYTQDFYFIKSAIWSFGTTASLKQ